MDEFEQAMASMSPACRNRVEVELYVQPETYHCHTKQLVIDVYRDAFAEGVASMGGSEDEARWPRLRHAAEG